MTATVNTRRRLAGQHNQYVDPAENPVASADWTTHPLGSFRRLGPWFADVTPGRRPLAPHTCWRLSLTPGVQTARAARTGGDTWRHRPDGALDLGEFSTFAAAVRAGDRVLAAHDREPVPVEWVGRADF